MHTYIYIYTYIHVHICRNPRTSPAKRASATCPSRMATSPRSTASSCRHLLTALKEVVDAPSPVASTRVSPSIQLHRCSRPSKRQ